MKGESHAIDLGIAFLLTIAFTVGVYLLSFNVHYVFRVVYRWPGVPFLLIAEQLNVFGNLAYALVLFLFSAFFPFLVWMAVLFGCVKLTRFIVTKMRQK